MYSTVTVCELVSVVVYDYPSFHFSGTYGIDTREAKQSEAKQSKAKQSRATYSNVKQSNAKQSKAEQSKAK